MQVKFGFIDDATSLAAMSLADLTFIIEEPRPSFFSKDCKHRDSPISVCWDRWRHIQTFHFVYASPRQATLYSRLDVPHFSESAHIMKSEISKFKRAYPGLVCTSVYHLSHQNSTSPFLTVFNELPTDVETIFQQIQYSLGSSFLSIPSESVLSILDLLAFGEPNYLDLHSIYQVQWSFWLLVTLTTRISIPSIKPTVPTPRALNIIYLEFTFSNLFQVVTSLRLFVSNPIRNPSV